MHCRQSESDQRTSLSVAHLGCPGDSQHSTLHSLSVPVELVVLLLTSSVVVVESQVASVSSLSLMDRALGSLDELFGEASPVRNITLTASISDA